MDSAWKLQLALLAIAALVGAAFLEQAEGAGFYTQTFSVFSHNVLTGDHPTAKVVNGVEHGFGRLIVVDDTLTSSNDINSQVVGWVKGTGADADVTDSEQYVPLYLTFYLEYKGLKGTVIAIGTNIVPNVDVLGDLAIAGGTGDFILSKGIVSLVSNTYDNTITDYVSFAKEWKFVLYHDLGSPVGSKIASAMSA